MLLSLIKIDKIKLAETVELYFTYNCRQILGKKRPPILNLKLDT